MQKKLNMLQKALWPGMNVHVYEDMYANVQPELWSPEEQAFDMMCSAMKAMFPDAKEWE